MTKSKGVLKFKDVWISFKASTNIIAKVWKTDFRGDDMQILNKKSHKALKDLFYWSKVKFKEFSKDKDRLKLEIYYLQEEEAREGWLDDEMSLLLKVKIKELNVNLCCLNTWWKQRAKNSNGVLTEEPKEVEEVFFSFFQNKWKDRVCFLENWPSTWKVLEDEERKWLDTNFSNSEIMKVVRTLDNNKTPCYDESFASLVMECVVEPRFSILINGGNTGWIVGKSGFRQGMDLGINISPRGQKVSHLLYADDLLVFFYAKIKNIKKLKSIVEDYCKWTGQKINLHKYVMICGKYVLRRKKKIGKLLGIKLVDEMEYLGVKIALRRLRKADFQILLDKYLKKLNSWGNRYILLALRLVLVKTAFMNLPLFLMAHSLVPLSILKEFDKLCLNFIWNKYDGGYVLNYVAWNVLCKPKALGGWGVQSAVSRMGVLREKFAWNLMKSPATLLNKNLLLKSREEWWSNEAMKGGSSA
ncbi:hypothetical protein KFK09_000419 [Dendrobium nobile]|uniref:Uncharacterized protein n=1 Tax=Dendrobium nobile TaxID=94219 RepID=A0A8T3C8T9_DENNO|nr:hypothetical protein KFK09_000419 [Dendrobium nobile]